MNSSIWGTSGHGQEYLFHGLNMYEQYISDLNRYILDVDVLRALVIYFSFVCKTEWCLISDPHQWKSCFNKSFSLTWFEGLSTEGVTCVQIVKPCEANAVSWCWAVIKFDCGSVIRVPPSSGRLLISCVFTVVYYEHTDMRTHVIIF